MPHFRNDLITIVFSTLSHDLTIHSQTVGKSGRFRLPVFVRDFSQFIIHSVHSCHMLVLNGLLRLTSRGCSIDVAPPGITYCLVFLSLSLHFTESNKCTWNMSHTKSEFGFRRAPGRLNQLGNFSFGIVFSFEYNCRLKFGTVSHARQDDCKLRLLTTSGLYADWCAALKVHSSICRHIEEHRCFIHVTDLIKLVVKILPFILTKEWKDDTLASTSLGNFWAICVRCLTLKSQRLMNFWHHPCEPLNSVYPKM